MRRASRLAVVVFGVAASGCSASDPAAGDGVDPGTELGVVTVMNEGTSSVSVFASFEQVSTGFPARGGCLVLESVHADEVSAGRLTFDVPGFPKPLVVKPTRQNSYATGVGGSKLTPGAQVSVNADGGAMRAFQIEGVVPAGPIVMTSPKLSPSPLDVDAASGLGFTWTPGEGDVLVSFVNASKPIIVVQCRFDAADGSGTIPGAALSAVPTETQSTVTADAFSVASTTVDDWTMILLLGALVQGSHQRSFQQQVSLH